MQVFDKCLLPGSALLEIALAAVNLLSIADNACLLTDASIPAPLVLPSSGQCSGVTCHIKSRYAIRSLYMQYILSFAMILSCLIMRGWISNNLGEPFCLGGRYTKFPLHSIACLSPVKS